ncbi:hypothetical protein FDB23_06350 [Clostridium botulinum]|nr:hypothetical protein [Clostridium botulinum]
MSRKPRYFIIVSHCLLNPSTRVHVLGKRYEIAKIVCDYFLDRKISIIQLPCPEFTAMGYMRNPQGRQQYDNTFFRKHCKKELQGYVDMICELKNNNNTPLCYIGIQGSPTCSINWGEHKINKYKIESIMEIDNVNYDKKSGVYGIMTEVLDDMLKEQGIIIPYIEAPVKEDIQSEKAKEFFNSLYDLFDIPNEYREPY